MREKIIEFLEKKQEHVSGDALANRLGISRQALWKHIQELKEMGYDIAAIPHVGYRLVATPDRLFPCEVSRGLGTEFVGQKVHYFEHVFSTMDEAMRLGILGAPCGTLVVAESQTKGRGRLGRCWFSPKYKGLYVSLLLRPRMPPALVSLITLLAAVSIVEAIYAFVGLRPRIKWPNDIMLQGKKLGGILTELNAEMDKVKYIVIGIGLNVNNDKKSLIAGGTSLREHLKEDVRRVALLQEVLCRIEENYLRFEKKGGSFLIEKWREHNMTLGKRVKVYCHKEHIEGEAVDIDVDGGLLVRKDSGITSKIMSGDVVHCRES
jgi:BirA family transcriptional regulator, biotin operon repressor / biotin---[acetyl-CoA-carboxylase] ligase